MCAELIADRVGRAERCVDERSTVDQNRPRRPQRARSLAEPAFGADGELRRETVPGERIVRTVRVSISDITRATQRGNRSHGTNGGDHVISSPVGTRARPRRRRIATPTSRDRHSRCPAAGKVRSPASRAYAHMLVKQSPRRTGSVGRSERRSFERNKRKFRTWPISRCIENSVRCRRTHGGGTASSSAPASRESSDGVRTTVTEGVKTSEPQSFDDRIDVPERVRQPRTANEGTTRSNRTGRSPRGIETRPDSGSRAVKKDSADEDGLGAAETDPDDGATSLRGPRGPTRR